MWPNSQFPTDLVMFTEEILNGKFQFLCSITKSKFRHQSVFADRKFYINFSQIFNLTIKKGEVMNSLDHDLLQTNFMKL